LGHNSASSQGSPGTGPVSDVVSITISQSSAATDTAPKQKVPGAEAHRGQFSKEASFWLVLREY